MQNNQSPTVTGYMLKERYWEAGELITIGTFAALIKVSTMLIAIAGGGMNPVSLVLKNIVGTSLLVILVYKVRKFGVMSLYSVIGGLVSLLSMGDNIMILLGTVIAGFICDCFIALFDGYRKVWVFVSGVGLFDLLSRTISLGYSWFLFREDMRLFIMGVVIVSIGYFGCLIGLPIGIFFAKELRHAGIIRQ